jgi:Mg2+ and Co2+ transporter CorA
MTEMADTLRGSFHALHEEQAREKAKAEEENHRRFERWAIVFLVPTFLASLAGANTWVPGEHNIWGFIGLVVAMIVLTLIPLWKLGLLPRWPKPRGRGR